MPRLDTQDIPPALLDDYLKTLAPTRYDNTHWGGDPDQRDIAARRQQYRTHGDPNPSAAQLVARNYFKRGTQMFHDTTQNEKAAYYDLALGSGLDYYNWFMQRNIHEFHDGKTNAELLRPDAARFNLNGNPPCANMEIVSPVGAGGTFRWDVENISATEIATCSEIRFHQLQLVIFGRLWTNGTYSDTPWKSYNLSTGRTVGALTVIPFSPPPRFQRLARIWRHSNTASACVVWRLTFEDQQPELSLTGFLNT